MALHAKVDEARGPAVLDINPLYGRIEHPVPKHRLPAHAMDPDAALQVIRDELILDGNARLNLATFVTTWMEPQAEKRMADCFSKNMMDKDEYPQTAELERRCVSILAHLWHAPAASPAAAAGEARQDEGAAQDSATGCSTTGSSEAAMLGGLALLWRWRARRGAAAATGPAGLSEKPNLVMGANVQVCWEKFCRYWQVEPRLRPLGAGPLPPAGAGAAKRR